MASEATLDFDRLLAPISPDKPCGERLRLTPLWTEIKDAQKDAFRKFREDDPSTGAAYRDVLDKASNALATRSKDLELCRWVAEAGLELYGFAGLRDGIRLVAETLERYWDSLYPTIDGDSADSLEARTASLELLAVADGAVMLPNRIRLIPLGSGTNGKALTFGSWQTKDGGLAATGEGAEAPNGSVGQGFMTAALAVSGDHFLRLRSDIDESLQQLDRLDKVVTERFGRSGPSLADLRRALTDCRGLVNHVVQERGEDASPAPDEAGEATAAAPKGGASAGPIRTRDDAIRRLNEVAEFFQRTEPHSPISYLVRRAASWGKMPLDKVLAELVKDASVREQIGDLLGFPKEEQR